MGGIVDVLKTAGKGIATGAKALGSGLIENRTAELYGPNYRARRMAADLANQKSEQAIEANAAYQPLRRQNIESQIENRQQTTQLRQEKMQIDRQKLDLRAQITQAKLNPASPENQMKTKGLEGQLAALEAKSQLLEAQTAQVRAETADPQRFMSSGGMGALTWVQGPQGITMVPKGAVAGAAPGTYSPPPSAAQRALSQQGEMARQIIGGPEQPDSIWDLASRINTHSGLTGRVVGLGRRGAAMAGSDPDVQVYQDQLAGMASRLAKAFGESGRLSDQDILRTVNMFPRVGDSPEVTTRKLQRVSALIDSFGDDPQANATLVNAMWSIQQQEGGDGNGQAGGGQPPVQVSSPEEWNALPPGTVYTDPNGVQRTKGGQ